MNRRFLIGFSSGSLHQKRNNKTQHGSVESPAQANG